MKSMEKVMQKWKSYGKHFQQNRLYMGILLLTAVCAYGYKVTNATIGIDDTPSLYYFEEGLIAIVGRWVLFLLNKVVSLAEFVPFVTDFAAVVILVLAAVVWSALFYSVLGEKVPTAGYAFFGAVFLSSPLLISCITVSPLATCAVASACAVSGNGRAVPGKCKKDPVSGRNWDAWQWLRS